MRRIHGELKPLVAAVQEKTGNRGSNVALRPKREPIKAKLVRVDFGDPGDVKPSGRQLAAVGVKRQRVGGEELDRVLKLHVQELSKLPGIFAGGPTGAPPCIGAIAAICRVGKNKLTQPAAKHGNQSLLASVGGCRDPRNRSHLSTFEALQAKYHGFGILSSWFEKKWWQCTALRGKKSSGGKQQVSNHWEYQ